MTKSTPNPKSESSNLYDDGPVAPEKFVARHPDGRKTFLEKWATTILCTTLFLMPLIIMGSLKSLKVQANDVAQWLPKGFQEAKAYKHFKETFGMDEMAVLSWPDCKLGNPQVLALQDALAAAKLDGELAFSRVTSGPELLRQIESAGISEKRAMGRLAGLLLGPDGETTCVLAYPAQAHFEKRLELVKLLYEVAEATEVNAEDLRLGGPVVDGAAIQTESSKALSQFLWLSVCAVFLLTWLRMRDLPLSILVISLAGLSAGISLAILYWTGGEMNLTMVMLPTLTFILGVSGCVHMVNYYRKASTLGYGLTSADQAIKDGGYPVALSSATTAVGMLSLATSSVIPIRNFGFYSACGVLASVGVMLLVMPSMLYLLRGRISKRFSESGSMSKRERETGVSRSTSLLLHWVCRSHWWVVIPTLIGLTLLATGIMKLGASVKLQNRFAARTKIIADYQWLETNLGPLVPMEVVLHFSPESKLERWDQMQLVKSVERAVKQTTAINASLSVATFEPTLPRGLRFRDRVAKETKLSRWKADFEQFQEAGLVRVTGDESYWRISLRVAALNDIDYGDFLETVQNNVENQMGFLDQHGVSAWLTGGIPLIYKAQHQILADLMYSFLTAFLIITVLMMVVMRSITAGLVSMIPNVFPPLVVFGAMGWLGFSIEIGSVMTASVALGIAVDDTLHFLTWFRRGTMEGLSRFSAIRFAFGHCAKAMIDTSLICGLGVLPFVFGVFMPTVKFATLLLIMLFTALLGDLILLPAILAGPAGILFRARRRDRKSRSSRVPPPPPHSGKDVARSTSEPAGSQTGDVD